MTYAELLQRYIKQSGKTLEQISKECAKKGVQIHPTYISKLRLGKRPAPSEEISRVLAEVTGGDPQRLIIKGFVEKIPKDLKEEMGLYRYISSLDDLADDVSSKVKDLGGFDSALETIIKWVISPNKDLIIKELENRGENGETYRKYLEMMQSHPEELLKGLKEDEKLDLLVTVLPWAEIVRPLKIEALKAVLERGLLTDDEGNPLPDHLVRPLLAHVDAIIEGLKGDSDEGSHS